ncbi:ABC-three component system protein [Actinotignum sp. GS-2025c]|uniref:ABC-three component system protein n=1 Tax=Actinotignum sp. GS-2025c TaxID=3427276 RepID=UPI003F449853
MFLHNLGSSDERFKQLNFHGGLNIVLADKTAESTSGDSRNGAGKTSFIRILRYLLGGSLDQSLKIPQLFQHSFWANLGLDRATKTTRIERPISPQTKVFIDGSSTTVAEWRRELAKLCSLPTDAKYPTVGQLFGQLARDYFADPLKTYRVESDWESGIRIGFFLGFSPELLGKASAIVALEKNRRALQKAMSDGAFGNINLSESELRADLAQAREKRSRLESHLAVFRVDEQYADHQQEANRLSHAIRDLNDEGLSLEHRKRDIELTIAEEHPPVSEAVRLKQLEKMYAEIGITLPEATTRRFSDVVAFHASVIRNRKLYLKSELQSVNRRLEEINSERQNLDQERARVMKLLQDSMALETFRHAQHELTEVDSLVSNLEQKLDFVQSVTKTKLDIRAMEAEAEGGLRTEIADLGPRLEAALVLFQKLGEEIYTDRKVSLLIEVTNKGTLKVIPKIDGDASAGIQGVKTFLLDMVCVVTAIPLGRAPRILVHDSQLFDSMDDRQVASCLNIGARLADEVGFQYIVTLNSDRLTAAENEGFERRNYAIDPVLTDAGETGGLFGFRFD